MAAADYPGMVGKNVKFNFSGKNGNVITAIGRLDSATPVPDSNDHHILAVTATHAESFSHKPSKLKEARTLQVHSSRVQSMEPFGNRRTADETSEARNRLLQHVRSSPDGWARVPEWATPADVAHLEEAGHVESKIQKEHDTQHLVGSNAFGGRTSMQRKRKYIRALGRSERFNGGTQEGN